MTRKRKQQGKALLAVLAVVVVAAVIYYFYFFGKDEPAEPLVEPPVPETVSTPKTEPVVEETPMVPEVETIRETEVETIVEEVTEPAGEPLPDLADSDEAAFSTAIGIMGETPARTYLVPESLISKLVATIDALSRDELSANIIPVRGPGGEMQATSDGETQEINPETGLPDPLYVFDPVNDQRYTPHVEVLEAIDTVQLIETYNHYYPLLQQSYRELGYAEGEFQDRLLEVINHLLSSPEPEQPVSLLKPEAFYEFADPQLESLSAGQKLLIRMGSANAGRVKEKLREIRNGIQTQRE